MDADWRIVRVNQRQEELSRLPRSETVGRTFAEVWPELAARGSLTWRAYDRCMRERVPVQFQAYYAPLDLWTGVSAYPVRSGGIAVFFRDISAVKRAEREHARLAAIVENTDDAIISKDLQGLIQTWNQGAERLFGYAADEVIGRPITLLLPPDRGGEEDRILAELRAGHRIHHYETTRVRKDGAIVDVSVTVSPLRDAAGELVGASKIAREITERKRAASALRTAEERLRSVIEHLPAGLIVADLSTRDLQWNRAALALHGYSGDEEAHRFLEALVAEHDLRTLAGDPIPVERWPLPRLLRGERFSNYEVLVRNTRLGWERVFSYSGVVLALDPAAPLGLMTIQDVTDRSRAETSLRSANQRLVDSDRRKDEFLGMLSHELRNPLAPIRNSLYILEHAEPNGHQARRAREIASRQVAHLTRLVDDLLDVTRIARGKIELRRTEVDLGGLARATAEDYRPLMRERGLDLAVAAPDGALVDGDETRLAQVLGNLLSNSAKFTPPGGRVTLTVTRRGDRAVVQVRDSGAGITPDLLPAIFDPFVQAKQTLARSEGGLGLGLALVKGLVELHGGRVSASSGGPDRGTEFTVDLPLVEAARTARSARGAGGGARRTNHVLIVDDNVDAAESLAELVRMFGHEVEVAHDGPTALARVFARRPDVVLCDLGLPGMDGYEIAKAVRARLDREIQLVAVSGYAQPEDVKRSVAAGFDAHVPKPPDPARIEHLLARRDGSA